MGHARSRFAVALALSLGIGAAASAGAQQPAAGAGPAIGEAAPEFSGLGATRHGRVADPIRLSDYKGKTIVLAFFFRARTTG